MSDIHDSVVQHVARTRFPFPSQTTWPADFITVTNAPDRKRPIQTPEGDHFPDIVIVDGQGLAREIGEVEMTVGPDLVTHLRAGSETAARHASMNVPRFFVYVPAGLEADAQRLLETHDIAYSGVRGFARHADGTISVTPFVTKGDSYDHQ